MTFDHGSRRRLSPRDLGRFAGDALFDRVARAVCRADCLPRKELYESWEVARRVRRRARGGRVVEIASGHALLAHLMLVLDDSSPGAIAIDPRTPASAGRLAVQLVDTWPRLAGRVTFARTLADVTLAPDDVVVSAHACGGLTDDVLAAAIAARTRVAVLPCCHVVAPSPLAGWLDGPLAIDVARAQRLEAAGYAVHTQTIDAAITPKNRLLLGTPRARAARDLRGRALVDAIRAVPARDRDTWVDELLGLPPAPPDEPLPRGAVPNVSCAIDDVLAMLDAVALAPTDTLVDLGAGLGRVAMLAHLVTGARAHGIELQASLVELARARCAALALPAVTFTHADAAAVPLAGSAFFLYAPCNGELLRRLLARLAAVPRPFVVATIDLPLDDVPWLRARPPTHASLAVYDAR